MWNAARHHMPFCTREGRWTGVAAPREAALQTPGCRVQSRPPYLWRVAAAILQTVATGPCIRNTGQNWTKALEDPSTNSRQKL